MRIRPKAGAAGILCACKHGFGPASPLDTVKGALTTEAVKAEAMMTVACVPFHKH